MKAPKLLELFSGTGSVGKVATLLGYDVVSVDLKNADINADILTWDYKQYDMGTLVLSMLLHHAQNTVWLRLLEREILKRQTALF